MANYGTLTRYPPEVFANAKLNGSYYPTGDRKGDCDLERCWYELHLVFKSFGSPLDLAISGDYGYEGGLDGFGEEDSISSDHYLGFASPTLVREISGAIVSAGTTQIMTRMKELDSHPDSIDLLPAVIDFYTAAANAGDCVFICVA